MNDDEELQFELVDTPQPWWDALMAKYTEQSSLEELRRFISLWVCVEAGAAPDKMADIAGKHERFLKGTTLRTVEEK